MNCLDCTTRDECYIPKRCEDIRANLAKIKQLRQKLNYLNIRLGETFRSYLKDKQNAI